jgi:hypothetical protein
MNPDPITNRVFSDTYQKFVLQNQELNVQNNPNPPPKFDLKLKKADKSDKSKNTKEKPKEKKKRGLFDLLHEDE